MPAIEGVLLDIDADIGGAHTAGIPSALGRSKFRQDDLDRAPIQPDAVCDSTAALPGWIRSRG
jgi:ribonucleotide monophosphatase NagD (HAD superfamily)